MKVDAPELQGHASFARRVPHIGTYRREFNASLERLYENALDWEHLPYLHRSSFSRIELIGAAGDRWRAWVWPRDRADRAGIMIELALDRACRRWITTTLAGSGAGTEVWTHAFTLAARRTEVVVDFFVPELAPASGPRRGLFYNELYRRLYDEDEAMMIGRQRELDQHSEREMTGAFAAVRLGPLAALRSRLPLLFACAGRRFRLVEIDDALIAHPAVCPHRLGPLDAGAIDGGVIECPWHGYRFDLRTGECVSGAKCRLSPAPLITVDPVTSEVYAAPPRAVR